MAYPIRKFVERRTIRVKISNLELLAVQMSINSLILQKIPNDSISAIKTVYLL